MITTATRCLLPAVLLFSLLVCGKDPKERKFTVPDNYRTWEKLTDEVLDYPIPGHGKSFRVIYANPISYKPEIQRRGGIIHRVEMKDGSTVIKEVYENRGAYEKKTGSETYRLLTIMHKDPANPKSQGGWLYYIKKPGSETRLVKGKMCYECHISANESHPYFDGNKTESFRDYLFTPVVK